MSVGISTFTNAISVGIGQCAITRDPSVTLVTYGLGSCVGLALWDPMARVAALLHVLLPTPPEGAVEFSPTRFAQTGVPHLLQAIRAEGAHLDRLKIYAAGGARMLGSLSGSQSLVGNIGERNAQVVAAQLQTHGLRMVASDFGGSQGRTLSLVVETGECWIRLAGAPAVPLR